MPAHLVLSSFSVKSAKRLIVMIDMSDETSWTRCVGERQSEFQFIIPLRNEKVLLTPISTNLWELPSFLCEDLSLNDAITTLRQAIGLRSRLTILRLVHSEDMTITIEREELTLYRDLYLIEVQDPVNDLCETLEGLEWVPLSAATVECFHSARARLIAQELDYIAKSYTPPNRVVWAQRGWFREICEEFCKILHSHNIHMEGDIEQVTVTEGSTVLRSRTTKEDHFLKCSAVFTNDAAITDALADIVPEIVQKPLFVDARRRIMVTRDHGEEFGTVVKACGELLCKSLSKLHRASMPHIRRLEDTGLQVFSADRIEAEMYILLHQNTPKFVEEWVGWEKVKDNEDRLKGAISGLRKLDMPLSVVHNDYLISNLYQKCDSDETCCFSDFGSSYIAHPMFDVVEASPEWIKIYAKEMGFTDFSEVEETKSAVKILSRLIDVFRYSKEMEYSEESDKIRLQKHILDRLNGLNCVLLIS